MSETESKREMSEREKVSERDKVSEREKVSERVYETAKRFMERFLGMTEIGETELQLLAATCLLVSSKLVGERVISAKSLIDYADHNIWIQELLVSYSQSQ